MRTLLSEGCATSTRQGDAGKGLPEPALALWDEQAAGCQQRTKQWRFNALIPACRVQSSTQPLLQSSEPSQDEGGEVKTPPPEPASLRSPQRRRYPPGSSPSPPPSSPVPSGPVSHHRPRQPGQLPALPPDTHGEEAPGSPQPPRCRRHGPSRRAPAPPPASGAALWARPGPPPRPRGPGVPAGGGAGRLGSAWKGPGLRLGLGP